MQGPILFQSTLLISSQVTCHGGNGVAIGSLGQYLEDSSVANVRGLSGFGPLPPENHNPFYFSSPTPRIFPQIEEPSNRLRLVMRHSGLSLHLLTGDSGPRQRRQHPHPQQRHGRWRIHQDMGRCTGTAGFIRKRLPPTRRGLVSPDSRAPPSHLRLTQKGAWSKTSASRTSSSKAPPSARPSAKTAGTMAHMPAPR